MRLQEIPQPAASAAAVPGEVQGALPPAAAAAASVPAATAEAVEQSGLERALEALPFGAAGGSGGGGGVTAAARLVELAKAAVAGRADGAASEERGPGDGNVESSTQLLLALAAAEVAAEGVCHFGLTPNSGILEIKSSLRT